MDTAPETIADDTFRGTFANFSEVVGQPFDTAAGEAMVRLTLAEATATGPSPLDPARETFSLLFHEPTARVLPQGIWRLTHGTLGPLDIFIVPIAQDQDGTTYQAIFN